LERGKSRGFSEPKTNVKEVNEKYYARWWRGDEARWLSVSLVGRSSGILLLWDKKKGRLVHSFRGVGDLRLCLESGENVCNCKCLLTS